MENKQGLKKSTIKRLIRSKMDQWLNTIEDEELRKLFKQNLLVTGGAISSGFLGERINDFDVYFKTKEALLKAAVYLVEYFNRLNNIEVDSGVKPYRPEVRQEVLKDLDGNEVERVLLYMKSAGAAGEGQSTYSYFEGLAEHRSSEFLESATGTRVDEETIEGAKELADSLQSKSKPKYRPVFLSQNAITLQGKIQVVIRFWGSPEEIHKNFDFVHCTGVYGYDSDSLSISQEALESLLTRDLKYIGSLYPVASLFRMKKFVERGWRISAGQIVKIAHQVSKVDFTCPQVLREQLLGVDYAYMHQLIEALENREQGTKIDEMYLAKLIDTIFE